MNHVFDTSAYSQLVRGERQMAALVLSAELVLMPQVCIAELRYGFACGSRQAENDKLLARFLSSAKVRSVAADNLTIDFYVRLAVQFRKKGKVLSHHDLWIAALAQQYEATLITFDRDFAGLIPGAPHLRLLAAN